MKKMNYTRVQLAEYLLYRQNQVVPVHYTSTRQRALFTHKWTGYTTANGKHYLNNKEIVFDEDKTAFLDRLVNDPRFEMFSKGWSAVYTFLKDRYVNIHQSDVISALQRSEHHQKYAPSKTGVMPPFEPGFCRAIFSENCCRRGCKLRWRSAPLRVCLLPF